MNQTLRLLTKLRFFVVFSAFALTTAAFANPVIPIPSQSKQPVFVPHAPNIEATSYILMDATSGHVLAEKNADKKVPPASLTKLMTMYIISSGIQGGQLRWDDKVHVSSNAWKTEGSRMFVKANSEVPLKELANGVIVVSGNDAAVALSEHVAGSEEAFSHLMNQQADIIGMKNTHFTDSTGLPHPNHYSTAHDLALLARAYVNHFPEDYALYSQKWFKHNKIRQPNRNRLLWRYKYADGLKTGHTKEAGYCLVSSAKKDNMRLIAVVLGAPSDRVRTEDSVRLLTYGFRFFETHKLYNADAQLVNARVWKGQKAEIPLGLTQDLYATVPTGQYKNLKATIKLQNPIKAPIKKGDQLGSVIVSVHDKEVATAPLIALENDKEGGMFRRATDTVKYNIHKYFSKSKVEEKFNTG